MSRKKILILFPLEHIAFSPTTLGVYDALSVNADVTIYAPTPKSFGSNDLKERKVEHFDLDTSKQAKIKALPLFLLHKFLHFFNLSVIGGLSIYDFVRFVGYKKALNQHRYNYDEVIAVDMMLLYLSERYFKKASFLSLELTNDEIPLLKKVKDDFIRTVIIQSKQRYTYLFGEKEHRVFYVQNAPVYMPIESVVKKNNALLFNGTATPWFGMYHCLKFISNYPQFSLTFKGAVLKDEKEYVLSNYASQIANGTIILNEDYMESRDMLRFLSQYEIGFCFYDLSFPKMNTYNYQTAPSGKMFAYLAAGVPVIANKLDGLKVIEDFEAGILVNDFEPETIYNAVNTIKNNYEFYKSNCCKAAEHYSFDKNVVPVVRFFLNQE
ncbi:hypothetical protein ACQ33O_11585 [Ferruginibacter sp. SUN002]|uniref:hypothetical protein n=1 Tax=Ferruginibacter sp. SUN002 TaxID=2937789 RepID=UPI003D36A157